MHKKGSTIYPEAKKRASQLFESGGERGDIPKLFIKLQSELRADECPPHVNYFYRWYKEWKLEKETQKNIAIIKGENIGHEPFIKKPEPFRSHANEIYKLIEPPELDELVRSGVPKKLAPRLLSNWDVAFQEGDPYRTTVFRRIADIFKDLPGIPYDRAKALAELELHADEDSIEEMQNLAKLFRRYRPWESKENQRAFNELYDRWLSSAATSTRKRLTEERERIKKEEMKEEMEGKKVDSTTAYFRSIITGEPIPIEKERWKKLPKGMRKAYKPID